MMHSLLLQDTSSAALLAAFIPMFIFGGLLAVLIIAAQWVIFKKAGYGGWEAIIPIYGTIVLLRIVGKPWWWLFLFFIPLLGIIWLIWMTNMLSKSFGKDEGFTVGLLLLGIVFYPILAFGSAQYQGPYGDPKAFEAYQASKQPFDFEKKTA